MAEVDFLPSCGITLPELLLTFFLSFGLATSGREVPEDIVPLSAKSIFDAIWPLNLSVAVVPLVVGQPVVVEPLAKRSMSNVWNRALAKRDLSFQFCSDVVEIGNWVVPFLRAPLGAGDDCVDFGYAAQSSGRVLASDWYTVSDEVPHLKSFW